MIHHPVVEILTAKVGVTRSRLLFVYSAVDGELGYVEGGTSNVVY
jgi:hypothetical protein